MSIIKTMIEARDFLLGRNDPILVHNFLVFVGPLMAGFSRISGLEHNVEVEYIKEGGLNDRVHVCHVQSASPKTIVFEKGVGTSVNPFAPLYLAMQFGCILPAPGCILILDNGKNLKNIYTFDDPVPVSWKCQDLDASRNDVIIETFNVLCSGITQVPVASLLSVIP